MADEGTRDRGRVAALEAGLAELRLAMVRLEDRMGAGERARAKYVPVLESLADEARAQRLADEKVARMTRFRLTLLQRATAAVVALSAVGSLLLQVVR